jgi:hypothetical protein
MEALPPDTAEVAEEVAEFDPPPFVPVTTTVSVLPMSPETGV